MRRKPDITAADGVFTTLPARSGLNPFYGTSAAAPHAGAIAALLKSAQPSLTPAQIRTILTSTALDIETPGYDNVSGYGIVQAAQAIEAIKPAPQAALALGFITPTEGAFSNGNGSIEPGELANLVVQLRNFSLLNATNVVVKLATGTPGITIVNGVVKYDPVSAESNTSNTALPFTFGIDKSVACVSTINFTATVSYDGGGGSQAFYFTVNTGARLGGTVSSKLGSPPPASSSYYALTGIQTGRLNLDGVASACGTQKIASLNTATGAYAFDAYTYTNTSPNPLCITTTLGSASGTDIFLVAYNDSGYVPASPALHYLADAGTSANTSSLSFTIASGKKFTLVVQAVAAGAAVGTAYALNLNFNLCYMGPTCNAVTIANKTISGGATGLPYVQPFIASGGSGSGIFNIQLTGSLPAGLYLAGDTLKGIPTQAGSFPISIVARDPAGCTSDTSSFTLVIAGVPPASVTAISGTPQQTNPTATFGQVLQAIVKDAGGNGLAGVKVVFSAPPTGAGGSFASQLPQDTVITNSAGVAVSSAFTANTFTGTYTVTANVNGIPSASFSLTNYCPSSFIVTSSADSGPGTLRDVLAYACPGVTITFDPGVKLIKLTMGDLYIPRAVTITGPGAGDLTISGENVSRIFLIDAGASSFVNISGITIANGLPSASSSFGGGGLLIISGIVNLSSCVVSNCDASRTYYGEGGGIDNEGGSVTINRCSIINNLAYADGGGITQYGGSIAIINSTISGNDAGEVGVGGGIFVYAPVSLTNATVYGNSAVLEEIFLDIEVKLR